MISILCDFKVFGNCVWRKLKTTGPPALNLNILKTGSKKKCAQL